MEVIIRGCRENNESINFLIHNNFVIRSLFYMFFLEFLTKMTNKLTIMDVLGAASANDMKDLNTTSLAELFKFIQIATPIGDKTFGALKSKRCPRTADEIKIFWNDIFINREFTEAHPINNAKNKYTDDPTLLIHGNKKSCKTFNVLANFGLGDTKKGKTRSNSYVEKENLVIGGSGGSTSPATITSDAQDIIDEHSHTDEHENGSDQSTSKGHEHYTNVVGDNIADQLKETSTLLQTQISQIIDEHLKGLSEKVSGIQKDMNKAIKKADDATQAAKDAKVIADNNRSSLNKLDDTLKTNSTDILDAQKDIEENRTKLASLTNDFHQLKTGQVAIMDANNLDEFTILRYYTLNKQARADYRKAVNLTQTSGLMIMNVTDDHSATYVVIDAENETDSVPNYKEIEDQLAKDADGNINNANRVKIKTARAVKNKQNKWLIAFQINATNALRGPIVRRLIDERFTNAGHFGLRQDIPEQYNIDQFLGYVKANIKEAGTGHAILHSFDVNRFGYYVIYLNDYVENGYEAGIYHEGTTRLKKPKEFCSIIRPACPREFAKLQRQYFTINQLFKLTKPKEYFCYAGHILKVPESAAGDARG